MLHTSIAIDLQKASIIYKNYRIIRIYLRDLEQLQMDRQTPVLNTFQLSTMLKTVKK